jgi:ATP-dependent helicase HrpB
MWTKGENGGLAPFATPEILAADLTGLVLELALWGASDPTEMPFLTQPREADVEAAKSLLVEIGALTPEGRITDEGRKIAAMPVSARLGHMVLNGGQDAPLMAALLEARDVLIRQGAPLPADLSLRWQALKSPVKFEREHPIQVNRAAAKRVKVGAKRLKPCGKHRLTVGAMAALAYPDRIGMRRGDESVRYHLSGGSGAALARGEALAANRFIVATDLDGDRTEATIRMAAAISESEIRDLFADRISETEVCEWSRRDRAVRTRLQTRLGALALDDRPWPECPPEKIAAAMLEGLRNLGHEALPWTKANRLLLARIGWLRVHGADLPDCSPVALLERAEDWLLPYLGHVRSPSDLKKLDMNALSQTWLSWEQMQQVDRLAPAKFTAPTGTVLSIDYSGGTPSVSVRLQEVFGITRHPTVGPDRTPLQFKLLSPAHRPLQMTSDLPGFWANSYHDVRKDMRGRYPKHVWPEDPTTEPPTRRTKPKAAK